MNNNDAVFGMLCAVGIIVAVVGLVITMWWQIFEKTGYGGAMSLLMLLPVVNLIMMLVLAFGDWPVQQEVRRLRRELADRDDYGGRGRFDAPRPRFEGRDPPGGEDTGYRQ